MKSPLEKQPESVVLLNEPKFTEHEADREFNERRRYLADDIQGFIAGHPAFKGKRVEVTFSHNGISSLVSILDTREQKFVLKIPLKVDYSRNEAAFLEAWEQVGVAVPHVIETGEIGEHQYLLMEYVDALTVRETYTPEELVANGMYGRWALRYGRCTRRQPKAMAI